MPVGLQNCAVTDKIEWVIPLDVPSALAVNLVGTKAANLGRMLAAGFPVPRGFSVTTRAFRQWFESCRVAVSYLDRMEQSSPTELESARMAAAKLREALAPLPIPGALVTAVANVCSRQGAESAWAVRSSATTEDGHDTSFAGQHDTVLDVRGPAAIVEAIRRCWISLFADRAVVYRLRNRLSQRSAAMAVLIQEMVPADTAGVLFSSDPITGDPNRILIEGTSGLGEALVSGKVNPDRFVVARATREIVDRRISRGRAGAATFEFDDSLVRRLAELALQAERLFAAPQDVEWAVAGDRVFVLQSRPITGATVWHAPTPDVWSNANMCENLPDVLTPMGWSVFNALIVGIFRPLLRRFGVDLDARPWFGLIAGRVYMNLTTTHQVLLGLDRWAHMDLSEILGGAKVVFETPSSPAPHGRRLVWSLRQLPLLFQLATQFLSRAASRRGAAYLLLLRQRLDALASTDFQALSNVALGDFIPAIRERAFPEVHRQSAALTSGMACIILGFASSIAALRLSRRWLGDHDGSVIKRLLVGSGNMASAESALDLYRLAAWARQHPELARLVQAQRPLGDLRPDLEATSRGREFLDRWTTWMNRHGHHARGEMDIYRPRWSETPDCVLDLLRGYLSCAGTTDLLQQQTERSLERQRLFESCLQRLRNPVKRWLLTTLIDRARHGLALRENVKSEAVRAVAVIRRALFEAGDRLVRRGILDARDDVFFLTLTELRQALMSSPGFHAARLIVPRRLEFSRQQALRPPPIVDAQGTPGAGIDAGTRTPMAGQETPCPLAPDLAEPGTANDRLIGLAVSPGVATGRARVILRADDHECLEPGEILVAPATDPGWTPYFLGAAAIVVDIGGQLSHGSILAREFGIPAVVNVGDATRRIHTGQVIRVDANEGIVTIQTTVVSPG